VNLRQNVLNVKRHSEKTLGGFHAKGFTLATVIRSPTAELASAAEKST
jgi:hypothetical protein